MRLIYVRHGEPDYANDCLTETGRQQAIAVSKRLQNEGISEIYTSPMGRASQTASYTSELLDIPIQTMDYMHEITWGGPDIPAGGHPWTLSDRMIDEDVPCEEIMVQINAIKSAIHKVGQIVLEGHINLCVREGIEHGDADKTIEEFTEVIRQFSKI